MKVIRHAAKLNTRGRPVCLAIGMFDGVHLGHQQVIREAVSDAEKQEGISLVITFDQHPAAIVSPQRTPPLIQTLPQKLRTVAALDVDALLLVHFDQHFSSITGEDFIRSLVHELRTIHCISVGSTFTFGHQRSGNVELLRKLGKDFAFSVHGLAAVSLNGHKVSSTRIRESVRLGDFDAAGQMLGREYSLAGKVVTGDRLGRQLGFPTANLDVAGLALPPSGVYAIHASVSGHRHRGVLNIGHRPTLENPQPALRVEAHLLDFDTDVYEKELQLTFVKKLRDEKKFPSLDALREQIQEDVAQAERLFDDAKALA